MDLKQLKTLIWHPVVLFGEHCLLSTEASKREKKVCIYHGPESFGHACDVSSYYFFNVKKLNLSSKGLNIRENE